MGLDVTYPEIVWPKQPPSPGAAPLLAPGEVPEAYKELQADGVPQNPVAGVPPQLIPADDDALEEPGVPVFQPDPNGGKPTLAQSPDTTKSVTGETVKTEATGWMKELNHFGDVKELGISFKRGALNAVPDFIMGVNAEVQGTRIANSVGLGENDMQNFKEFEPTLRIALGNTDDVSREASRQRILAVVDQTLGEAGIERRSSARHFINSAFDQPKFLEEMTERSKFRYNVFTDPVMQAAFEMQDSIKERNPQDMKFVGSWADKLAGGAGTIASAIAGRKVGGQTGGAAFLAYQGSGQEFDKALKAGADPEIAFKAASLGRFIGLTDVLPIERLVASPKVTKALFALAISAGKQAMAEGAQEGFQTYMSNVLAKTLYKPDQDVSQGVWESVVLGAILGAGADLATGGFRQELAKTPEQLTEEALSQSAPATGPGEFSTPPAPGSTEKPAETPPPVVPPMAPATGEAAKPASPTATTVAFQPPAPMKVGDISKLPPATRAVEADYVMAHDFGLIEPIQQQVQTGAAVEDITAKVAPLLTPVTEYLARRGVTDPAEVKLELDDFVRSVVAKLAPEGSPQAPSRSLPVPAAETPAMPPPAPTASIEETTLRPALASLEEAVALDFPKDDLAGQRARAEKIQAAQDAFGAIIKKPTKEQTDALPTVEAKAAAWRHVNLMGELANLIERDIPAAKAGDRAELLRRKEEIVRELTTSPAPDITSSVAPGAVDQTETPEFKAWFGDSKVVGPDGRPQVVYHGTGESFKKIEMDKGAMGTFWFTSDRAAVESGEVGASGKGIVMELYAKIENPAGWAEYDKFSTGELIGRGFDGVILPEKDGSFTGFVFEPDQIKSATSNDGSFDASNPDITASVSPPVDPLAEAGGEWRSAMVNATLDSGETVEMPAGAAVDFLNRRLKSLAELLECVNAG